MPGGCQEALLRNRSYLKLVVVRDPLERLLSAYLDKCAFQGQELGLQETHASHCPGFSLGPRNCVGQALAMAELKRVTAALASRFVFEAVEPPTPDFFLTLKPSGARLRARRWSAE